MRVASEGGNAAETIGGTVEKRKMLDYRRIAMVSSTEFV